MKFYTTNNVNLYNEGIFIGLYFDMLLAEREVTKTQNSIISIKKANGIFSGGGVQLGYTFTSKNLTIEPVLGLGVYDFSQRLNFDNHSFIDFTATEYQLSACFFQLNIGYRF
jgi:hypothetical protein